MHILAGDFNWAGTLEMQNDQDAEGRVRRPAGHCGGQGLEVVHPDAELECRSTEANHMEDEDLPAH